jgi:hypothetical protein
MRQKIRKFRTEPDQQKGTRGREPEDFTKGSKGSKGEKGSVKRALALVPVPAHARCQGTNGLQCNCGGQVRRPCHGESYDEFMLNAGAEYLRSRMVAKDWNISLVAQGAGDEPQQA